MNLRTEEEYTIRSIHDFFNRFATEEDRRNFCERHEITRDQFDKGGIVELPTFVGDTDEIEYMLKERNDNKMYMCHYISDTIIISELVFDGDEKGVIPFIVNEIQRNGVHEVLSKEALSKLVEKKL